VDVHDDDVGSPVVCPRCSGSFDALREFDAESLEKVAQYFGPVEQMLLLAAGMSIFFGFILLLAGGLVAQEDPRAAVLALVGLGALVAGIVAIAKRAIWTLILCAVSYALLGLCFAGLGIVNLAEGADGSLLAGMVGVLVLGLMQVAGGVVIFVLWAKRPKGKDEAQGQEAGRRVKSILKALRKAHPDKQSDVIEFTAGGNPWKARLQPGGATLVNLPAGRLLFVQPGSLVVSKKGKEVLTGRLKVEILMRSESLAAVIWQEHFERYEAWRRGEATGDAVT